MARNASAGRAGVAERDRAPGVAAGRHRRLERDLAEQRDADLVGQRLRRRRRRTAA